MDIGLESFLKEQLEKGLKVTYLEPHRYRGHRVYYSIHINERPYRLILEIERKKTTDKNVEIFTFRIVEVTRCIGGKKEIVKTSLLYAKLRYEENKNFRLFSKSQSMSLNGKLYLIPSENLHKVF